MDAAGPGSVKLIFSQTGMTSTPTPSRWSRVLWGLLAGAVLAAPAKTEPWLKPGDTALRSDLHTLADALVLRGTISTWPIAWIDILEDLRDVRPADLDGATRAAYERVLARARIETLTGHVTAHTNLSLAERPRVIRTFDDTPREEAQIGGGLSWTGERLMVRLEAARVWDPTDGETVRVDGSYFGAALGNWMLSVGFPERWWGPGWDGSLILSNNARPMPQISINRARSTPFDARWLRWLGPWSLTSFVGLLDDDRAVDDALLFGMRFAFRPLPRLELGLSRTAQWCGEGRPCDAEAFANLLLGRDNRGVNVPEEKEPGNQLGGFDVRWAPFEKGPAALYLQWIGEDSRQGGPQIGSWLRQMGVELAGSAFDGRWRHRTHIEAAETICRDGALGFSSEQTRCAYEHSIYLTGYRYQGRSIGHGIDGDGRSYTVGSVLMNGDDRIWRVSLRRIEVNRTDAWFNDRHGLAPTPQRLSEMTLMHNRPLSIGVLRAALGYSRLDDRLDSRMNDRSLFGWVEFVID
jgi:hypothetical protein